MGNPHGIHTSQPGGQHLSSGGGVCTVGCTDVINGLPSRDSVGDSSPRRPMPKKASDNSSHGLIGNIISKLIIRAVPPAFAFYVYLKSYQNFHVTLGK